MQFFFFDHRASYNKKDEESKNTTEVPMKMCSLRNVHGRLHASKVVLGLSFPLLAAVLVEAQVCEKEIIEEKRTSFGLSRALPEEGTKETFDIPGFMICLAGLLIAGVVISPFFKKGEEVCEVT
jgi:hypothetical protein